MHNEKTTIFIDGSSGTAGLRIYDRLAQREDIDLLTLPPELHHDIKAQRELINRADIAFLCLPDAAAITAADLVENPDTVVLDTSTAHRTAPGWTYGFPELSPEREAAIRTAKRIAVPGCHASGFIALVYPLVAAGLLNKDALLSCYSLTGYSGGGKKMIAEYEAPARSALLDAPRQYALGQTHIARGLGRIGHGRRRAICRAQQAGFAHVAGVDVNGAQTVVDAHACAVRAGERRVFNASVAQGHGKIAGILDENFGERAAARQRAGKHALADR